jgi:hypothetical protein
MFHIFTAGRQLIKIAFNLQLTHALPPLTFAVIKLLLVQPISVGPSVTGGAPGFRARFEDTFDYP